MNNITSKELLTLGFKRVDVSAEESGGSAYYYYIWEFDDSCESITFITNASDECKKPDQYEISIFDYKKPIITKFSDLKQIITIFNSLK